jgi:hypothetical protein
MIKMECLLNACLKIILVSILCAACTAPALESAPHPTRSPEIILTSTTPPTETVSTGLIVSNKAAKYSSLILESVKLKDFASKTRSSFIKASSETESGIYFETRIGNKYQIQKTVIEGNKYIITINRNNKKDIEIFTDEGIILAFHTEVNCPPNIEDEGGSCYDLWGLYSPDLNSFVRIGNSYQWEIELTNHGFRTGDYFGVWLALNEKWTTRDELCSSSNFNFIRAELKNKSDELGLNFTETDIDEIMERWHAYALPNGKAYRWGNPNHPCPAFNLEYF